MQCTTRRFRDVLAIAATISAVPAGTASAMPIIDPPQRVVSSAPTQTAPLAPDGDDVGVIAVLIIGGGALLTGAAAGFGCGRVVVRRQFAR
jgi:hypothetical protein